jgi:predicted transposase YbfD/YdcC
VRSVIAVRRDWSEKKQSRGIEKSHTRWFVSSLSPLESNRSTRAVREHWSVENLNHWKRDASPWQEDRHRHRRPNAALNLALTRNALLALIPFERGEPLALYFERYHRDPAKAVKLLLQGKPLP